MPTCTLEAWRAKGDELFGADFMKWKFVCPVCGHIATVQDWKDAGAPAQSAAFSCVGRWAGANPQTTKEGTIGPNGLQGKGPCNYAGGGLFQLNPVSVIDPDGVTRRVFAFAEPVQHQSASNMEKHS
jgi:hypothetical protein